MRKSLLALPVVILFACGGGGGSATTTATPVSTPQTVTLTETEFSITPVTLSLKPGAYVFHASNTGKVPHDLHIADADGNEVAATTKVLAAGDSADVQATLKAGIYTMYCALPGHRAQGMQGKITVS